MDSEKRNAGLDANPQTEACPAAVCPACGRINRAGARYCTECGYRIDSADPSGGDGTVKMDAEPQIRAKTYCKTCGGEFNLYLAQCPHCGSSNPLAKQRSSGLYGTQAPVCPPGTYMPQNINPMMYGSVPAATSSAPLPPGLTKREYIKQYLPRNFVIQIRIDAIICYACAGISALLALLVSPWGLIDALLLAGFALGFHLGRSYACAILLLVLGAFEVIFSAVSGMPGGGALWLGAGIWAVVIFSRISREYQRYQWESQHRADRNGGSPYGW